MKEIHFPSQKGESGSSNKVLGFLAGFNVTTASDVICIVAGVSGEDVSGGCYIGNIFSVISSGGTAVSLMGKINLAPSPPQAFQGKHQTDQKSQRSALRT